MSNELYNIAQKAGVEVLRTDLPSNGSASVQAQSGRCYIGMDKKIKTRAEERVHLGHELGHCLQGAFYNPYSPFDVRQKHENRADHWAMRHLIPPDKLVAAFQRGITDIWELAETFDVTEDFIRKTVVYYDEQNLL